MKRSYPLHIYISALFLMLVLLIGGLIGGVGYMMSRQIVDTAATELTRRIARETSDNFQHTLAPAEMAVQLLSHDVLADKNSLDTRLQRLAYLREALNYSSSLSSLYLGYENGDFFFMRRLLEDSERATYGAPAGTRFVVQSIERFAGGRRGTFIFLDTSLRVLGREDKPEYAAGYDPRSRSWYRDGMRAGTQIKTPPYLFFSNQKVGSTIAMRCQNGKAVVGADILLETLGKTLAREKVTPQSQVALVNPEGVVIAHENMAALLRPSGADGKIALPKLADIHIPALAKAAELLSTAPPEEEFATRLSLADGSWRLAIHPVRLQGTRPGYLVIAIPDSELLAAALKQRSISAMLTLLIILVAIPLTWLIARRIAGALRSLTGEAEAIRRFDFNRPIGSGSFIVEVNELSQTMDGMKHAIRRFLAISQALAAEENFDRLLPMLLAETLSAANADAGVLFLADGDTLSAVAARRADDSCLDLPKLSLPVSKSGPLISRAIECGAPQADTLTPEDMAPFALDQLVNSEQDHQGVAVPLLNRHRELVGVMLLLGQKRIGEAQVSFVNALSGSAASALETQDLIRAQKALFESFIRMIAGAIDAKSPYTGGHCARVPELTKMLARAACSDREGPFRDFELNDEEWEAVHIAAWLHDCGKVTTPEYVVDKATKLETIYDRIHEVRMRFEVLKRDAEIACLQSIAAGEPEAPARQRLAEQIARLDDDYAFVAACNEGGEFMAPEMLARLKEIAGRTWLRTLDDRIGISHEEKERKARTPAPTLPVAEALIADRPEHRIERTPKDRLPDDEGWGFHMAVPELLYNRGELYNLSVGRGTLSNEERYKINEHIVQTTIMLAQLPFPKHLRRVPEIAGGHHEKMDGSGYPKGLRREEMSPLARMMAIADIFEALTAVDRPYKKGKTLSEAIRIMSFMQREQHIDPDLFALFLRSGVYLEYARRFMQPDQIDAVEIAPYLAAAAK